MISLSEKKLHKIGRIDQIVRDYFADRPTEKEVSDKNLMPLFIEKGIFEKDNRARLPIRSLLRQLDAAGKLMRTVFRFPQHHQKTLTSTFSPCSLK